MNNNTQCRIFHLHNQLGFKGVLLVKCNYLKKNKNKQIGSNKHRSRDKQVHKHIFCICIICIRMGEGAFADGW